MNAGLAITTSPAGNRVARAVAPVFHKLLDRIDAGLAEGGIEASLPDGTRRLLGGRAAGPVPIVVVHRWRALVRLAMAGSVGWYEGWAAGDWSSPDPVPLFDLFMRNRVPLGSAARSGGVAKLAARAWHRFRRNDRRGARRLVEVDDGDLHAVGGQTLGDGCADAAGGSGHDRGTGFGHDVLLRAKMF